MFKNRSEAGLLLAKQLNEFSGNKDAIVLSIPRGGTYVGAIVASKLRIDHDILLVKKIAAPFNPELAIGAIAEDGSKYMDWELALRSKVEQEYLDSEIEKKIKEIDSRAVIFRRKAPRKDLTKKRIFILTDDGAATGATMKAAILYLKHLRISKGASKKEIIIALPVVAADTYNKLKKEADRMIAINIPDDFSAVGQFYQEFPQVSDEEVIKLLANS